jgi:hypothetical protein
MKLKRKSIKKQKNNSSQLELTVQTRDSRYETEIAQ